MSNRPGRKISRQTARRPQHRKAKTPSLDRRVLLIIGVMVAASVIIGLVVVVTGNGSGPSVTQTSASVQVQGASLPIFDDTVSDTAIGMTAPGFITTDFDGISHEVTGDGGPTDTAKVIGMFAHWCPHCQVEVPVVSQWLADNQVPDGVEVIAISSLVNAGRGNYPPSEWFQSVNWPSPVLLDSKSDELAEAFGLSTIPYWIVLGPDNTVLDRQSGEIGADAFAALVDMAEASVAS